MIFPLSLARRRLILSSIAVIACQFTAGAFAQSYPQLFRQRPQATRAERNASSAAIGDIDLNLLKSNPARLAIVVPGNADLLIDRHHHDQRSAARMVWRGRAAEDHSSKVTLTLHDGILLGHIQSGNEIFSLRPGRDGRTIVEKIDSDSFNPEWGHDHRTHGHDQVPPKPAGDADLSGTGSTTGPVSAAAPTSTEIVLMSVYTPQARAAAGGTEQIQAEIQAAVDQANSAFINSEMSVRYHLAHSAEVVYNDSGNIIGDLNWVTGNAAVAQLRNTHAADMVSLITENGGGYCGIAWVQRNPGAGFASYAFQVTARGCLSNQTLAHEHGHNLGMEHDPASAGISASSASYQWSFGHNVPGVFRTIMSYACPAPCPRVLHFSNPDILYSELPTGIANERDNAWTGDLTAPIVAKFRSGGGRGVPNNPPAFITDPISKPNAIEGLAFASSIARNARDTDTDALSFAKSSGPAWLIVAVNGDLTGTPGTSDLGLNTFTVTVTDGNGVSDSALLQINVLAGLAPPTGLVGSSTLARRVDLIWNDNSTNEKRFKIERSSDGINFTRIAARRANVTAFTDRGRRSGLTYYYRVRSYNANGDSPYSNTVSVVAR